MKYTRRAGGAGAGAAAGGASAAGWAGGSDPPHALAATINMASGIDCAIFLKCDLGIVDSPSCWSSLSRTLFIVLCQGGALYTANAPH
jgi:hypothetical protein